MCLDMYILLYKKVEGWTKKDYNKISNLIQKTILTILIKSQLKCPNTI